MDPYLEDPTLWPDVHGRLINVASELLLSQLRPRYFIQIDERLYLASADDEASGVIVPDLRIREVAPAASAGTSATGTAQVAPGLELAYAWEFEVKESYLQVIDRELHRVVTVVEVLSPANKVKGSVAHKEYDGKRRDVLEARTNLVEIDLLREGTPLAARPDFPPHEYMAQVWRFRGDEHPRRTVWPMSSREPLKTIPVPVRPEDPDAVLNLQQMLNIAYDRAGYELRVDYSKDPAVPLRPELTKWARDLITEGRAQAKR